MTDWKAVCAELEGLLTKLHEYVHADGRFLLDEDSGAGSYGVELDISIDELLTRTRAELVQPDQPEPEHRPVWTEGIFGDGAAILRDGVMQSIEDVIAALNATSLAQPPASWWRSAGPTNYSEDFWRRDALEKLVHAATSFRVGIYSPELLESFENKARATLARWGRPAALAQPEPKGSSLAHEAYIAFVQICKGNSDDAGTYEADEELVRCALKRLSDLELARPAIEPVPIAERLPEPKDCDSEGLLHLAENGLNALRNQVISSQDDYDAIFVALNRLASLSRPAIEPVPNPEPGVADHITDDEGTRWDHTMDAALWAKAFCLICPEMASREDVMIGWFANAIMAGWDHQAWKMDAERKPVPVCERLPELKDCDTKGRCWFVDDDEKWCPVILGDILDEDEPDAIQRVICYYGYTHWVQGWALPVPSSPTNE